jgi:hypothetical protein
MSNNVKIFNEEYTIDFEMGQIVYLKTDGEQIGRMILGINLRPNGQVLYSLAHAERESQHYAIEISAEKDIIMATS